MDKCPGCGAEVVFGAASCWECNEPLEVHSKVESEPLEGLAVDGDLDSDLPEEGQAASEQAESRLSGGEDAHHVVDLAPASAVVAYVAQDEVQAVTISQLLSECGIENIAGQENETENETQSGAAASLDASKTLSVQVARENLAAARQIIDDFTSQFEEPAD